MIKELQKKEEAPSGGYTKQYCQKCHKTIKIDFLDMLLNGLDDDCLCQGCRKLKGVVDYDN